MRFEAKETGFGDGKKNGDREVAKEGKRMRLCMALQWCFLLSQMFRLIQEMCRNRRLMRFMQGVKSAGAFGCP